MQFASGDIECENIYRIQKLSYAHHTILILEMTKTRYVRLFFMYKKK